MFHILKMHKFQVGEEVLVIDSDRYDKIINKRAIILELLSKYNPDRVYAIKVPEILSRHEIHEDCLEKIESTLTPEEWFDIRKIKNESR